MDRQQDVIQGFTTMYYYLTSSLLTARTVAMVICDRFKMALQSAGILKNYTTHEPTP